MMQQGQCTQGVVLYQKRLERGMSYVELLSQNGKEHGVVHLSARKERGQIIGQDVFVERMSRPSSALPRLALSLQEEHSFLTLMDAPLSLLVWRAALDLCRVLSSSEDSARALLLLVNLREELLKNKGGQWKTTYVQLELAVLQMIGFGMNIEACVVTKEREHLRYISPKTGAAVVESVGRPYARQLFTYPVLFMKIVRNDRDAVGLDEFFEALSVTGFFLKKYVKKNLMRDQIVVWGEHE